jgi:LPS-assembly lipoprotein
LSRIAALLVALALSACGFQLRGDTPMGLKSLYVTTNAPSQVATEIRRRLASGPTRLAPDAKSAEAELRILSESTEKTIQTLTGAGRVFDYLLRLHVGYQVTDAAGKAIVAPTEIEVHRLISYSESAPLAKEAEERLLFQDMQVEAAGQILRRIAVTRANAAPP